MNIPASTENAIVSANRMSGERTVEHVDYPLTGDHELDCMSGLLSVIRQSNVSSNVLARVLWHLLLRTSDVIPSPHDQDMVWQMIRDLGERQRARQDKMRATPWTTEGPAPYKLGPDDCGGMKIPDIHPIGPSISYGDPPACNPTAKALEALGTLKEIIPHPSKETVETVKAILYRSGEAASALGNPLPD